MPVKYKRLDSGRVADFYFERSLDLIFSPGCFTVEIDHSGKDVGLPIDDCGEEHYFVGNLVVTDNGTAGHKQENRVTGQQLTITSRKGKETKVFTRTYADGVWSLWRNLACTGMYNSISTTDELLATVESLVNENTRAKEVEESVKHSMVDINSRLGHGAETIVLKASDLIPMVWNGTKMVSNTTYNIWVLPLTEGRQYSTDGKAYFQSRRTCSEYPALGTVVSMTGIPAGTFTATSEMKYLVLTVTMSAYDGNDYVVEAGGLGLCERVNMIEQTQLPLLGKTIVCFGDSITEFNGDGNKGYGDYLAELSGATVVRGGIGGTQLATRKQPVEVIPDNEDDYKHAYGAVDIPNLAKAWANKDWGIVDNAVAWLATNKNDDNSAVIDRLKNCPIESTDIVIVFGGTNDLNNGTYGKPTDTDAVGSVCGGINHIIDSILSVKPEMVIYFFTPIPRMISGVWSDDYRVGQTESDGSDLSFPGLVKRIKECVEYNHIACCDMYNTLGINRKNIYTYADDGVHPNHGYSMLANKMYSFIMANRIWN